MKKKLIAAASVIAIAVALTGCSQNTTTETNQTTEEMATPEPTAEPEATTEPEAAETPAAATAPAADTAPAQQSTGITEAEAKSIALTDAGLAEGDVSITKLATDIDDGVMEWEVEFIYGDTEYSYDIDYNTGAIRGKDLDSIYDD